MNPPLWFGNFLAYCGQVVWLVLAATGLAAASRLRAPRVLLAYWQGVLAACITLPVLQPWRSASVARGEATVSLDFHGAPASAVVSHSISVYTLVAGVLLGGMLVRLGWLALGLRRLRAIRRAAVTFDALPQAVRELELRFQVCPAWYLSPRVDGPATFGIRPPSILLPERFPSLGESSQRAIAGHELLHVARRDWILNLAEELTLTVFWFHPAVAWLVNRIRLSREQVVDAEVVRLISACKPYMSALLEIASGRPGPALGAAPTFLRERQLANRIELLVKEVTMSKSRLIVSLSTVAGLLVLAGALGCWAFPLRSAAQAAGSQPATKETAPRAVAQIQPLTQTAVVYPAEAKAAGIQGAVTLRVTIAKDGKVTRIWVQSGPPELVKACLEAVQQWRYSPSNKEHLTTVTVVFKLPAEGEGAPAATAAEAPARLAALEPLSAQRPEYPPLAKAGDIQGNVVLRVTVGKDGSVTDILVLSGHPLLVKAAMEALIHWRYAPRDKPAVTDVTLHFALPKSDTGASSTQPPMVVFSPDPPYTQEAKDAKLQGIVVLQVMIAADGTVSDVSVTKGLDKGLDDSAVRTVKTWKFLPAMKDGKPVPYKSTVEVNFTLY